MAVWKLIVQRVRGSAKGTSYTRFFGSVDEMNAARSRYQKLGTSTAKGVLSSKAGVRIPSEASIAKMSAADVADKMRDVQSKMGEAEQLWHDATQGAKSVTDPVKREAAFRLAEELRQQYYKVSGQFGALKARLRQTAQQDLFKEGVNYAAKYK